MADVRNYLVWRGKLEHLHTLLQYQGEIALNNTASYFGETYKHIWKESCEEKW
jgi:hypothetical protein